MQAAGDRCHDQHEWQEPGGHLVRKPAGAALLNRCGHRIDQSFESAGTGPLGDGDDEFTIKVRRAAVERVARPLDNRFALPSHRSFVDRCDARQDHAVRRNMLTRQDPQPVSNHDRCQGHVSLSPGGIEQPHLVGQQ